ncbi:hypothetical protein [Shewanella aegiceratis]|uniref:hypothetical protein n=1 Tax=Shewanella aegiceratis TaxID=2864203 RepID=UPI0021AC92F4|nr:hypothetical protein [Shewanella aegiceratis]
MMLSASVKSKIPLLFLVCVSVWWAFYYQSNGPFNDYGRANFEWLYLLDALVVAPLLCFFCIKEKKDALIKALALICLGVLFGSFIVPEQNKFIWHHLELGRYLIVAVMVLFEVVAIASVVLAIRSALAQGRDPDLAIDEPITKLLGGGAIVSLLRFETRIWTYALFASRIDRHQFNGVQHFSYHQKDGAQSNLLGFILVIAFEAPLMHLLMHYLWSPMAANVISLLTLLSLVFFVAEYRALSRRPISLSQNDLVIRCGLYSPLVIPLGNISRVVSNQAFVKRSSQVKRYNYAGIPNVEISLSEPIGQLEKVYLGVDDPGAFIQAIRSKLDKDC